MRELTLKYQHDASFFNPKLPRDDFGRLTVSVMTERFSGHGGFWVQWQNVVEFGHSLAAYPIPKTAPVVVQWGYDKQEGEDLILRFEVAPADTRGNLILLFEVADDSTDAKIRDRARGSFLTGYPEVEAFRQAIAKMMSGEIEEAVLAGR
jgi:hypothetical protein